MCGLYTLYPGPLSKGASSVKLCARALYILVPTSLLGPFLPAAVSPWLPLPAGWGGYACDRIVVRLALCLIA